jgi:hypothetical protein
MFLDTWEILTNPVFLIMFGLSAAPFLPLLYSVWVTWRDNTEREKAEKKRRRLARLRQRSR